MQSHEHATLPLKMAGGSLPYNYLRIIGSES